MMGLNRFLQDPKIQAPAYNVDIDLPETYNTSLHLFVWC